MTWRAGWFVGVVIAAAFLTGAFTATPAANRATSALPRVEKVAVIGVVGLRWTDIQDTPRAAFANISIRGESLGLTSSADGWAMIGSGARYTVAQPSPAAPQAVASGRDRRSALFDRYARARPHLPGKRALGQLAASAHARGSCVVSNGDAGAELAASGAGGIVDQVAGSTREVFDSTCRLAVLGGAEHTLVGRDIQSARSSGWTVIVVSVADDHYVALHPALLAPANLGSLSSASTRRAGYVQLVDVAGTVAQLLGAPLPSSTDGEPFALASGGPKPHDLARLAAQARTAHRTIPLSITALLLLGLLGVAFAGRRRHGALLWFGAMPAATFLAAAQPLHGYVVIAIVVALAAFIAWCGGSARGVGLATVFVIGVDVVTGARWQLDTPLGYSPLVAGRFAGLGNLAFGVFAAATILAMHKRARVFAAALLLVGVAIDGAPFWGADLGGTLALVPAGLVMLGIRGKRLMGTAAAAVAVAGAFALIDLARPMQDRTHLGRFAAKVKDGQAWDILHRKAVAALDLIGHSPLTILGLLVALAALVAANLRAGDGPTAKPIHALSVAGVLGFALNDSGLAAAVTLVWVAVPLISAATRPPQVSRVARRVLL